MIWTDAEVDARISVADALAAVRAACIDIAAGAFELPVRTALADGGYLVMPVAHRPTGTALTKIVSVAPGESAVTVDGLLVWTDPSGVTTPLAHAGRLTALRTAAVSAVAADALAGPRAASLTVFGTGPQARAHVEALAQVRALERVTVVGRNEERTQATCRELTDALDGVDVRAADDVRRAVREADLVCCATTATTPLFACDWLAQDVHVIAIGSHRRGVCEVPRELLIQARPVVVDDVAACFAEAGEVIDALECGALTRNDVVDLPRLLAQPGTAQGGRTVFKSVGTAAFDWALAAALCGAGTALTAP